MTPISAMGSSAGLSRGRGTSVDRGRGRGTRGTYHYNSRNYADDGGENTHPGATFGRPRMFDRSQVSKVKKSVGNGRDVIYHALDFARRVTITREIIGRRETVTSNTVIGTVTQIITTAKTVYRRVRVKTLARQCEWHRETKRIGESVRAKRTTTVGELRDTVEVRKIRTGVVESTTMMN